MTNDVPMWKWIFIAVKTTLSVFNFSLASRTTIGETETFNSHMHSFYEFKSANTKENCQKVNASNYVKRFSHAHSCSFSDRQIHARKIKQKKDRFSVGQYDPFYCFFSIQMHCIHSWFKCAIDTPSFSTKHKKELWIASMKYFLWGHQTAFCAFSIVKHTKKIYHKMEKSKRRR